MSEGVELATLLVIQCVILLSHVLHGLGFTTTVFMCDGTLSQFIHWQHWFHLGCSITKWFFATTSKFCHRRLKFLWVASNFSMNRMQVELFY